MKKRTAKSAQIINRSGHLQKLLKTGQYQQEILNKIKVLLDKQLAAHCISSHYSGQCLKLFADTPVWASRLRFQSEIIKRQLSNIGIPVHKLDVKVIPPSVAKQRFHKKRHANPISLQAASTLVETANCIDDEKLAAALKKLATRAS